MMRELKGENNIKGYKEVAIIKESSNPAIYWTVPEGIDHLRLSAKSVQLCKGNALLFQISDFVGAA